MSELVTLELNQNNAHLVRENGDYVVRLSKAVEIAPGDIIRMRMASIDSEKAQSNTIVIPDDINLGITYSYYDYDYTVHNKTSYDAANAGDNYLGNPWAAPTFDYYAMYAKTPVVNFTTASVTILSAIPASYNTQLGTQISGTFLIDRAAARARGFNIPESFEFQVTVQYIDTDGDYQTTVLTGSNAAYGAVPGAPGGSKSVFYNGGNTFNIAQLGGGSFNYQKGTMSVMGVTGVYVGLNGKAKGSQNDIPTESGSLPPSKVQAPIDSGTTSVQLPYLSFTFNETVSRGTVTLGDTIVGGTGYVDAVDVATTGGTGTGLTVDINTLQPAGTVDGVTIAEGGDGYAVGDIITITGGNNNATFRVAAVSGLTNLRINTTSVVLKSGSYDPASLAIQLTQLFNGVGGIFPQGSANERGALMGKNQFLTITDQGNNVESIFRQLDFTTATNDITFDQANTYHYQQNAAGGPYIPTYVGASKVVIEYGQQAGEVFALTYMHMPLEVPQTGAPANPPPEAVGYYASRTGQDVDGQPAVHWYEIKLASGVAIHQLSPPSFWQDTIGIYDQVIVPLYEAGMVKYYLKDDLVSKITSGFADKGAFLAPSGTTDNWRSAPITAVDGAITYVDTAGATYAILGDTVQAKTSGYFLVEIQGLTRRREGFVDSQDSNPAIQAIVSTQFDSNDRVTGFADSGLDYQHLGDGYLVSDLAIRILDPDTKQVVTNLGSENAILVDIIKGNSLPAPTVPPVLPAGRK